MTLNNLMARLQPWRFGEYGEPLLVLLPGTLWSGMVTPDRVLSIGQIKQIVRKQMIDGKLLLFNSNTWNHFACIKKRAHVCLKMDLVLKTYREQWMIGTNREREPRKSVLAVSLDDDDNDDNFWYSSGVFWIHYLLIKVDCLFVGFYGITFVGYLMPNLFLYKWRVLFQTIFLSSYSVLSNSSN